MTQKGIAREDGLKDLREILSCYKHENSIDKMDITLLQGVYMTNPEFDDKPTFGNQLVTKMSKAFE